MMLNKILRNSLFLLLFALVCSCGGSSTKNGDDIVLRFEVKNQAYSQLRVMYHMTLIDVLLNADGVGECVIKNIGAVHASVIYGKQQNEIYVEKGDDLKISFDATDFRKSMVVDGDKAPIIEYLNSVQMMGLPQEDYILSFADYKAKLEAKVNDGVKLLTARNFAEKHPKFVKIETNRIKYSYMQGLLMYPMGHTFMAKDSTYKADENYYSELSALIVEDEDLIEIKEYRDYVKEAANILSSKGENASNSYQRSISEMNYVIDNIKNDKIKQAMVNVIAVEYVEMNGIKNITELENLYNTYVTDPVLKAMFAEKCDLWDLTKNGKPSPNFKAVDIDGKEVTLKEFAGKYVYIDMWATWCGPCLKEAPFMKSLEEKFSGKNIVFVSLSIDANKADWESKIKENKMGGVALYLGTDTPFQKVYNVTEIPRFILIDKEGVIINNNMLSPSSAETEGYFNNLKGI